MNRALIMMVYHTTPANKQNSLARLLAYLPARSQRSAPSSRIATKMMECTNCLLTDLFYCHHFLLYFVYAVCLCAGDTKDA